MHGDNVLHVVEEGLQRPGLWKSAMGAEEERPQLQSFQQTASNPSAL